MFPILFLSTRYLPVSMGFYIGWYFNFSHIPQILRGVVAEGGAYPTHVGSESVIPTLAPALDEYAKKYGEVAHRAW